MTVLLCLGLLISLVYLKAGADRVVETKDVFNGEPVTLRCLNLVAQTNCSKVTWLSGTPVVELVQLGIRQPDQPERENRVSLTSDCSLHFSQVSPRDHGCYTCRQFSGLGGTQISGDTTICLKIKEYSTTTEKNGATSMDNNVLAGSTDDPKNLLMIIILTVLMVGALLVTALIAWLRNHRRAQTENEKTVQLGTTTTKQGEDVLTYTEINHNIMKPRNVDIDKEHQKTEYAVIKLG